MATKTSNLDGGLIRRYFYPHCQYESTSLLNFGEDFFDVGEDVDGRSFCVDDLSVELCDDRLRLLVEVLDPLQDRILCVVEVVPEIRFFFGELKNPKAYIATITMKSNGLNLSEHKI